MAKVGEFMNSGRGKDSLRRGKAYGVGGPFWMRGGAAYWYPMTRRRFASGLTGKSASSGLLYRGVARPRALMLLLRSLLRCRKLLPGFNAGGLPASCKNFFALEPLDGVEGGRLAEYSVPGPAVDADNG